jgi:hypothetical protein
MYVGSELHGPLLFNRLFKHQEDSLPDGGKNKLLQTIQGYAKLPFVDGSSTSCKDAALALVDDLLKLPEGKLVNSKGKSAALKWFSALSCDTRNKQDLKAVVEFWDVADVDHNKVCLVLGDIVREDVEVSDALLSTIKTLYDADSGCRVKCSVLRGKFDVLEALSNEVCHTANTNKAFTPLLMFEPPFYFLLASAGLTWTWAETAS